MNPITTLGSMQVHISYAKEYKRQGAVLLICVVTCIASMVDCIMGFID